MICFFLNLGGKTVVGLVKLILTAGSSGTAGFIWGGDQPTTTGR